MRDGFIEHMLESQEAGGEGVEIKERDRVRKIVLAAAQKVVDGIIDTPPDRAVSLDALVGVFKNTVRGPADEFRASARARYHERLVVNQGRLGETDITDLTCEDP